VTYVPAFGSAPNRVLLVGEAPGREEAQQGRPFVGKAGKEQDWYLSRHGLRAKDWYLTNVIRDYTPGNPDPTKAQIEQWYPYLVDEIQVVQPELIITVGRFATQWFLGDVSMESVHGLPHTCERSNGAVVVPVYHPAAGFYDGDARARIEWDYGRVAEVLRGIEAGKTVDFRTTKGLLRELEMGVYQDVSGLELALILSRDDRAYRVSTLGVDTEGTPQDPWSIQVSPVQGTGYVLRCSSPYFKAGIEALQKLAGMGTTLVFHNAMYDLEMCQSMGLNLSRAKIWDTMYAAYLTRIEPQGLKPLARRWLGVDMRSYTDVVGGAAREKQEDYLWSILDWEWDKPEARVVTDNDGTSRLYQPQAIERRVEKILVDLYNQEVDIPARWKAIDEELRHRVQFQVGPLPVATLEDVPLEVAVEYSGKDADMTLRLYYSLKEELDRMDLYQLMKEGMEVLPVFSEMQTNGMPVDRDYFAELYAEMDGRMQEIAAYISHTYYGGKPFNPKSPKQVGALLRRRGLKPMKRTATGQMSTSKDSIEHLRYTDGAIAKVFEWRAHQHVRDSFCKPVLERTYPGPFNTIRSTLKVTRTATRRLAATDPNLLNIPIRSDLGLRVRQGYVCPPGEVFGGWDLSQIEMRFMAHESQDEFLCRLFEQGRDIHSEIASAIFGIPLEDVDDRLHRRPAKDTGFGIIYGISASGLQTYLRKQGIYWSLGKCSQMIRKWLDLHKGVDLYCKQVVKETQKTGMVRDHWGMIRYLPGIWSEDSHVRSEAERIAVSHKIQGGAQGMIQHSMTYLKPKIWEMQDRGLNVHWCLQMHDEVILRFDEDLWEELNELVLEALIWHCGISLSVPVEAEGHRSSTWAGLK